ncbi:nitroreductase family protein [Acidocella aminolytica]|jgi:nitroreductase|uniref:Nitroreductase n=1 Tax=Acidocella aminolytica 101 = DSM 11237 TaxID=1120923 RepID=A0A0D6PKH6_9PROT|nr:nitroreductase family protein [Acidocella aminolytica]GAN81239.1 nitroreductase [Acidocella aminolytica 101 = DSM 11237]GBQ37052.1 nitroreductase [Acidocella aminolytica 101 = DSM 11237]SHE84617.1 Nitroreductase [Acidocella aminolytica 101 = DSM 11237]
MSLTANSRTADHPIEQVFLERWSPRAFTGEEISEHTLRTMFEAARWAPSSYNSQPWRFVYARRDNAHWDKFLGLLNEFNQSWAKTASALVFMVSSETMAVPGKDTPAPSYSHSFDTGAAWGYLALQAAFMGWQAHGMVGFDLERSYTELNVPPGFRVEAAVAIGRPGPKTLLPEALQAREAPSPRKPLTDLALEGGF